MLQIILHSMSLFFRKYPRQYDKNDQSGHKECLKKQGRFKLYLCREDKPDKNRAYATE